RHARQALGDLRLVAAHDDVVVGRAGDAVEVRARHPAVLGEDLGLAGEALHGAVEGRRIGVGRRYAQGDLLPTTGDPQRQAARLEGEWTGDGAVDVVVPAVEGDLTGAPGLAHDLHALLEHLQPLAGPREAVAVGAPLMLVPARTDAHLEPPAAHVVDRGGRLGQVHRRAVGHAGAHLPEAHPLGARRQR